MLTDSLDTLGRTALTGVLAYLGLIILLRVSGKRTLSALNAFDFVVTVALGSTLATILLSKDVSIPQGLVGLTTLVALQFLVALLSVHVPFVRKGVRASPVALVVNGRHCTEVMDAERVTRSEIAQAVRREGVGSVKELAAVVLETDGTLSIIAPADDLSALEGVRGWPGTPGEGLDDRA